MKKSGRIDSGKAAVLTSGFHGLFFLYFLNFSTVNYLYNK